MIERVTSVHGSGGARKQNGETVNAAERSDFRARP
jgi:hypothetical protein